jgi:hypothetical protein
MCLFLRFGSWFSGYNKIKTFAKALFLSQMGAKVRREERLFQAFYFFLTKMRGFLHVGLSAVLRKHSANGVTLDVKRAASSFDGV